MWISVGRPCYLFSVSVWMLILATLCYHRPAYSVMWWRHKMVVFPSNAKSVHLPVNYFIFYFIFFGVLYSRSKNCYLELNINKKLYETRGYSPQLVTYINLWANCNDRCDMERLKTSWKSCIDLRFLYFWKQVLFRPGWPIKNLITFMKVNKEKNYFQECVVFFNVLIKENTEVGLAVLGKTECSPE